MNQRDVLAEAQSRGFAIIAEAKVTSPFGFESATTWDDAFDLACGIGDVVSVHTDPRWGGSFELLALARRMTDKPILAKGIHENDVDVLRALELGADYVLVVGRIPFGGTRTDLAKRLLIEPNTIEELKALPVGTRAVWNSRDLTNGELKTETFDDARRVWNGWLCQASNITSIHDVHPKADAVLVGQRLVMFAQSLLSEQSE